MCGLVGVASQIPQKNRSWLPRARDSLTHRGPDKAGEWWSDDCRVGLAHRRLSIMDVSESGDQPMQFAASGLWIVFNGEIYNFRELRQELDPQYQFSSNCDTEVILAAYDVWGFECLSRFNGMFSFALYDTQRERVFLARDRAGEKPLFYRKEGNTLYFASELKALMHNPELSRDIDRVAMDCYLAMGFVPGEHCILQGYQKLPAAHAMSFDLRSGNQSLWRYWELPEFCAETASEPSTEGELLDELEVLLEDAVSKQLIADVPVGVLLSGGLDSSIITAMASRNSSAVKTFTIGFPGHGDFDETEHASLIARHFDTEHTVLIAEPSTADIIPKLAKQFDEPMVDSSMIPTWLLSHLVQQHCTVALGGDGGDELFGGYPHYSRLLRVAEKIKHIPVPLRKAFSSIGGRILPVGFGGGNIRTWIQAVAGDWNSGLPFVSNLFDPKLRKQLMSQFSGWNSAAENIRIDRIPRNDNLLQRATRMDFSNYMAEDILVKVDRASMLNSLEVRAPLLDYRLVEFAFGKIPADLKSTSFDKKILLKKLSHRILPIEFDRQRKQGFSIPVTEWLKAGPFKNLFYDVLLDEGCLFDRNTVQKLLVGQKRGHNNGERLFSLVIFELWRREYAVSI